MTPPIFSIVTATHETPIAVFRETLSSVLSQTCQSWEWCIADDGSQSTALRALLVKWSKREPRIKYVQRPDNGGIVSASTSAAQIASGEFLVFLDHDDLLVPNALEEILSSIEEEPLVDILYSDEDKIDESGEFFDEFRKPDFSIERLRGQNYFNHLTVIRRNIFERVGGFRAGFDGAQDYDLVLRVVEQSRVVVHIPKVLYHWRAIKGSTADDRDAKPYSFESARCAVAEHCQRVGISAEVESLPSGYVRIKRLITTQPLVSIVIPTRGDRASIWGLDTCLAANAIRSILNRSTYKNVEIVLVHDEVSALDPDLTNVINSGQVRIVWYSKPFDFSDKCNWGVVNSSGDIIVLLNDDTEVKSEDWLEVLIGYLQDKDVGAVGLLTLFEDGLIQSAGHGNNPTPHNLAVGEEPGSTGLFGERLVTREVGGLTGACLATRRDVYNEVGGMSLQFPINFNDVDFCFKLICLGYRVLLTPHAQMWHFESVSREAWVEEYEFNMLMRRWATMCGADSFSRLEEEDFLRLLVRPARESLPRRRDHKKELGI